MAKSERGALKATHIGKLEIGSAELNVAVLIDGTRIINYSSVFKALGRTKRGHQRDSSRVHEMPAFINAKNLQPFVGEDLRSALNLILYSDLNGNSSTGYVADILPMLCKVYLDARREGALKTSQMPNALAAESLLVALSKTGIVALVDEATGYQYKREKDELQKILKAYIAEELLAWQKTFPDVFYQELFRLNGWNLTVGGIKKRPGVIGKWTNTLVYNELPPGVLEELKKKTPKSQSGNYTARFFQSLTPETGNPHLTAQLNQVITLFRLSDNMQHMWNQFEKLKSRQSGQMELPFSFDDKGRTIEPLDESQMSIFDKSLKQALDYNPNEKKK